MSCAFTLTRRRFLEAGGLASLPFLAGGFVFPAAAASERSSGGLERIVQTCSTFDCGGKCAIKAHVKDGVVTRISTRLDSEVNPEMPVMRGCVRGRGYRFALQRDSN